jgi:hypothetical protein
VFQRFLPWARFRALPQAFQRALSHAFPPAHRGGLPQGHPSALLHPDPLLEALARSRGPTRRALCSITGRLVAVRAWERLRIARLGDYALERTGLSARSVQDLARVDAALAQLPHLEAALLSGEITWTKARLLARVATAEGEERWLALARRLSARGLSREVRALDLGSVEASGPATDEEGTPEEHRENVHIRCTPRVCARWYAARQLARRVARTGKRVRSPGPRKRLPDSSSTPRETWLASFAPFSAPCAAAWNGTTAGSPPRGRHSMP